MTNEEIGKLLGLTYSTVSRLRRGERLPSIEVMLAIDAHFGWGVADQAKTRTSLGAEGYGARLQEFIKAKNDDTQVLDK